MEGDVINIDCNGKNFDIEIKKCVPDKAISIIDANINIEFLQPKDFERIQREKQELIRKQREKEAAQLTKSKANNQSQDKNDPRLNRIDYTVILLLMLDC